MSERQAGRELDAEVAEKVVGWKPYSKRGAYKPGATWTHPDGYNTGYGAWPAYSTDIAAAWLIVEKMRGVIVSINPPNVEHDDEWCVEWFDGDHTLNAACANTAPLAICVASLAAIATNAPDSTDETFTRQGEEA